MLQLNKFSTKHDRIEQAFFIVVFVYESSFLEWGASPPNPPGFVALRATTHSARRSLWIALLWQFVQFNICSIVPVILFRCICPVGIWSIKYLFRSPLAQLTFCSIDFCSTDFLFNCFVQLYLFSLDLVNRPVTVCGLRDSGDVLAVIGREISSPSSVSHATLSSFVHARK